MNPVIGQCPICGHHLHVTRLQCRNCDTAIEGQFTLGRLYELSPEQLEFVETFLRCEGKINRVEQEIGLSYPAVRARLTDVIRALGYEVGEPPAASRVYPKRCAAKCWPICGRESCRPTRRCRSSAATATENV